MQNTATAAGTLLALWNLSKTTTTQRGFSWQYLHTLIHARDGLAVSELYALLQQQKKQRWRRRQTPPHPHPA